MRFSSSQLVWIPAVGTLYKKHIFTPVWKTACIQTCKHRFLFHIRSIQFTDYFFPYRHDPANPARHQLQCVKLLKTHPKDITTRTRAFNRRLLKLAHEQIALLRTKHWNKIDTQTQVFIDFLVPVKEPALDAPASKRRRGPRGKKGSAKKKARADAEVDMEMDADEEGESSVGLPGTAPMTTTDPAYNDPPPTIFYNPDCIHACLKGNPLLKGLVELMPGVKSLGSTVTIRDDET